MTNSALITELGKVAEAFTTESVELFEEIRDLMDDDYSKAVTFCKLLNDHGIDTVEQWLDAYLGTNESNAQFLEEYLTDIYELQDVPAGLVIDYNASWERNYRYDFFVIEFDGQRHYFSNVF
tara:strand:+ start:442 stop:807 length:366 start_codon:yes stop_codon:yes gene_type:complete